MTRNLSAHSAAWSITLSTTGTTTTESDNIQSEHSGMISATTSGSELRITRIFYELAALLLTISIATIVTGATNVRRASGAGGKYLQIAVRIAAGCDIVVGICGVSLAMRALGSHIFDQILAKGLLTVQSIVSLYAILIPFVYLPVIAIIHAHVVLGLSLVETRIVIALSALFQFSARLALLAAQFHLLASMNHIVDDSKTVAFVHDNFRCNALLYCANFAFAGFCTFSVAVLLLLGNRTHRVLPPKVVALLGVGPFPVLAAIVGGVMFLWGMVGCGLTIWQSVYIPKFVPFAFVVYILVLLDSVVLRYDDVSFSFQSASSNVGLAFAHGTCFGMVGVSV